MQIRATQTFLHGTDRYEEGEDYNVPDILAGYFVASGWAVGENGESVLTPEGLVHDITPDSSEHAQENPNG